MAAVASVEEVLESAGTAPALSDFRRDHHDRPLIVPPAGGPAVPYARASSGGKLIDDSFALEKYARRNVAFGMAHDASLVARQLAVVGTPQTWDSGRVVQ